MTHPNEMGPVSFTLIVVGAVSIIVSGIALLGITIKWMVSNFGPVGGSLTGFAFGVLLIVFGFAIDSYFFGWLND